MKRVKIPKEPKTFNPGNDWELTFEDNFEKIDETKWTLNNVSENHLRRIAYYADDCVTVRDGKLVIRTEYRENGEYGKGWYTGWLESATKARADENYNGFSQCGGYFEIRCKVPKVLGIWSAFWLMPDEGVAFTDDDVQNTGKDGAEIDIMESPYTYKKFNPYITQHAVHCDGYDDRLKSAASPIVDLKTIYDDFHTYALEWNENEYIFYVDGYETWRTNHLNGTSAVKEYIILSVEVAGIEKDNKLLVGKELKKNHVIPAWQGNPMKNDLTKHYDFTVDYVRVYKRK